MIPMTEFEVCYWLILAGRNLYFTRTLDHAKYRTVSLSPGGAVKAARKTLEKSAHRGHRPTARRGIDVTKLKTIPKIQWLVSLEVVERFAAARIRVTEYGGGIAVAQRLPKRC